MAREYARILTEIWRNQKFRSLSQVDQRLYLLLLSQPDISAVGLLPLRARRWADMAGDSTPSDITDALKSLDVGQFLVVDFDSEEVLVRAFVKWDGGSTNSKRKPVILRDALEVTSLRVRSVLAKEFTRVGLDWPGGDVPDPLREVPGDRDSSACAPRDGSRDSAPDTAYTESPFRIDTESHQQVDSASGALSRFDRVAVTEVPTGEPQPATNNQQPVPPSADVAVAAPMFELALVETAPSIGVHDIVAAWAEGFATTGNQPVKQQRGQVGREAKALLEANNDPRRVLAAARALGEKGRATLVAELAIQTNQSKPAATARPSTTDSKVAAGLALAAKYDAQQNRREAG